MNKYVNNKIVEARVTGIERYGIFVSLDDYSSGLIHISEISDNYVSDINNYAYVGEKIRVRIISQSDTNNQVKLSIKNLDYRLGTKYVHIKETGSGFEILKKSLNGWIVEKKNEKN